MLLATLFWQLGGNHARRRAGAPINADASSESQALDRVRAMILASPNQQLVASMRTMGKALNIPGSTLHELAKKWEKAGQIKAASHRRRTVFELPRKTACPFTPARIALAGAFSHRGS